MAKWHIDPDHSVAAFRVRHMMVAYVRGQFNKLSGSAEFDPADRRRLSLARPDVQSMCRRYRCNGRVASLPECC